MLTFSFKSMFAYLWVNLSPACQAPSGRERYSRARHRGRCHLELECLSGFYVFIPVEVEKRTTGLALCH